MSSCFELGCCLGFIWTLVTPLVLTLIVIRQTYTHTCMHTNIHIQRYIHTLLHTCTNSYIKASPHYPIDHRQWENDIHSLIHSGYFYSVSKSTTTQRRSRPH